MKKEHRKVLAFFWLFAFTFLSPHCMANPVTIEHRWGKTTITEEPKRIVSLSFSGIDTLLALGLTPHSYRAWFGGNKYGLWPWAEKHMPNEAQKTVLRGEINPEEIARMRPDFIEAMYSGISPAQYAALSRVAPVLPAQKGAGDFGTAWDTMLRSVGYAVGRQDKAEDVIQGIEALITTIRERHPDWEGKTAVVAQSDGPLIFSKTDPRMALISRLGFKLSDAAQQFSLGNFYFKLDRELTEPLNADVIVWINLHNDFSALEKHPLRHTLSPVKEGREIFLDAELSAALSYSSPLSIPYALKRLEPMLEKVLDNPHEKQKSSLQ